MVNLLQHTYCLEAFNYSGTGAADARQRPTLAFALVGTGGAQAATVAPASAWNLNGSSLANIASGGGVDWSQNDLFLGGFDNGHLLSDSIGGPANSYNLVPMSRRGNRGGAWAGVEWTVRLSIGPGFFIVKCTYDQRSDPRIPVAMEAAYFPLSGGFATTLFNEWNLRHATIRHHALAAAPGSLGTQVAASFAPAENVAAHSIASCTYEQRDFEIDSLPCDMTLGFPAAYDVAQQYVTANNWRIENDARFNYNVDSGLHPGMDFVPTYRLAAPADRPYAALDYMALSGALHPFVVGASANNVSPNHRHNDNLFNSQMRTVIMWANRFNNYQRASGQRIYVSDARAMPGHADPGTLGDGMVTSPEFDHIIPVTPDDGGLRGPTIFSNVHLVSPHHNSTKGGHLWVAPAVTIGYLRLHRGL